MNLRDRLLRLDIKAKRQAERGDQRHHQIDEQFHEMERVRDQLVAQFSARIAQVEANTGRIIAIEDTLAAHVADLKKHTGTK